jgi:hypothetical protein
VVILPSKVPRKAIHWEAVARKVETKILTEATPNMAAVQAEGEPMVLAPKKMMVEVQCTAQAEAVVVLATKEARLPIEMAAQVEPGVLIP